MRRLALIAAVLALAASQAFGTVKVGDRAPEIRLDKLIPEQPVANVSQEALAGKAVVLEIWATWCGPCVGAIPHLNQLTTQFKGHPIVFLSVTDEEATVAEGFLKKRTIEGLIGIAHTTGVWKQFGVEAVPTTFLIDAAGKIAAVANPEQVNAAMLEDLMAGRSITVAKANPEFSVKRAGDASGPAPLLDMIMRPSTSPNMGMSRGNGKLTFQGGTLLWFLSSAYGFPPSRITGEPANDTTRYDVAFSLPGANSEIFESLIRELIGAAFHIKVSRETREADAFLLTAPNGKPAALSEGAGTGSTWRMQNGKLSVVDCGMSELATALEDSLGKPVVNETGIDGRYDLELSYDPSAPEETVDAVRKAGFEIKPGRRPIEFLVVRKAQ